MNLKAYISLKLILLLVFLSFIFFLLSNTQGNYNSLQNRNEKLEEQKKLYESIIRLDPDDIEGKKKLYELIKISDKNYKPMKSRKNIDYDTSIWLLFISMAVFNFIIYLIDKRIDKLKVLENKDNDKML